MSESSKLLLTIIRMIEEDWYKYYKENRAPEAFLNGFECCCNAIKETLEHDVDEDYCGILKRYSHIVGGVKTKTLTIEDGEIVNNSVEDTISFYIEKYERNRDYRAEHNETPISPSEYFSDCICSGDPLKEKAAREAINILNKWGES